MCMIYYNYFIEIKHRSILLILSGISTFIISYYYKEIILFLLVKSNLKMSENFYFITTNITEMLFIYIKLAYFNSFQFLCLFCIYHVFLFLMPGLYFKEYKKIKLGVFLIISNYLFIHHLYIKHIFPSIWCFLINYYQSDNTIIKIYLESQITDYVQFYCSNFFILFLVSQAFILLFIYLLNKKNLIFFIKKFRKFFYSFFLLQSTLLTPPDIFSQIFVGLALIFIYEFIIILSVFLNKIMVTN